MKKSILFSTLFFALTVGAQEMPQLIYSGCQYSVQGFSENGKWITGGRQYEVAYRFNTETEKLEMLYTPTDVTSGTSPFEARDITNDGTIIGIDHYGYPAIYRDKTKGWERLPVDSDFYVESLASSAMSCTSDGKYIIGYLSTHPTDTPYKIKPALWTLNESGEYEYSTLPDPKEDFLGMKPQFTSPRVISEDGCRVMGPIVNKTGAFSMPIVWTRVNDEWSYDMPFVDIIYNLDKFKEILAQEPQMNDFITAQPTDPNYKDQVNEFIAAQAKWKYKLYTEGTTGKDFAATSISRNGRYLYGTGASYEYTFENEEMQTITTAFPAYMDLVTGEYVELTQFKDYSIATMNDGGDIITTSFTFIPAGDQTLNVKFADWLKEKYNGYDIYSELPPTFTGMSRPKISGDGTFVNAMYSAVNNEVPFDETFCLKLPKPLSEIIEVLNTPVDARIAAADGKINFSVVAQDVHVFNLAGCEVINSVAPTTVVDASSLNAGVYIVNASVDGERVNAKVYIK